MSNDKGGWYTAVFLIGVLIGVVLCIMILPPRVVEVEISPSEPDNALQFYVDYLEGCNYTVTEMELITNSYEEVDSFKEFLWLLEYGDFTECYVDYGESGFLLLKRARQSKLWIRLDGVFWELRL